MTLLVRTPRPYPTESLLGFLLRVSESNGYESLKQILHIAEVGREHNQILPGLPIDKVARILGREPREFSRIAYRVEECGSWHFKLLDHDLGQRSISSLRLRQPALCPQCVTELRHIDAFWDLRVAVACPKHRCKAQRRCSECGDDIRWFRPGLLTCHCGANLADMPSDEVDNRAVELMHIVEAKLHGHALKSLPNASGFPLEALHALPLRSLVHVIEVLGAHCLKSRQISESDNTSIVAAAGEVLEQWPIGYHRLLTDFGNRAMSENPAFGFRKQFAAFYEAMFKSRVLAGHTRFFRDEFIRFGMLQWGHAAVDAKLLRTEHQHEQRFMGKSQFARRFGLWTPTMRRLIAEGALVTKTVGNGRTRRVVIDVRESKMPVASAGIVTVREAADHLGLPVSVLQHLRDMGVFVVQPRRGHESSWHKDDVQHFLARAAALPDGTSPWRDTVQLEDVMRLKLRDARAKADIVAALFDGRLTVVCRTGQTLGSLRLDKKQLDDFVRQKRVEVENGTCSLPEVAVQTGLDPSAVSDAIASGLFSAVQIDGRLRVSAHSVERFNADYVPLSQLAEQLKTSTRRLLRICRRNGLRAISLRRSGRVAAQPILPRSSTARLMECWETERHSTERKRKAYREKVCATAMRKYLDELGIHGKSLPRRAGEPNRAVVARACGFSRDVLYSYPSVISLLEDFDRAERERLGTCSLDPLTALEKHLSGLRANGTPLPRWRRNEPNRRAIADACGLDRNIFYSDPAAVALLQTYASAEPSR